MIGAEMVGGVESFALSGPPNDVCRRNNDPKTRLFFDSSDVLDANEPVLWKWAIYVWAKFLSTHENLFFFAEEIFFFFLGSKKISEFITKFKKLRRKKSIQKTKN